MPVKRTLLCVTRSYLPIVRYIIDDTDLVQYLRQVLLLREEKEQELRSRSGADLGLRLYLKVMALSDVLYNLIILKMIKIASKYCLQLDTETAMQSAKLLKEEPTTEQDKELMRSIITSASKGVPLGAMSIYKKFKDDVKVVKSIMQM